MTQAITADEMNEALKDAGPGSILFISYLAGREPTEKALVEADRATNREGMARRHSFGALSSVWTTKAGDRVMRVFADTRDTLQKDGTLTLGAWRTYNPHLGKLLSLRVIHKVPLTWA